MFNTIKVNNTDTNYTHSIFDISEYTGKTYNTLSDALADVPDEKQKGGMTVCYETDDNKYVQYRLMATSWSINDSDWQGVDNTPILGSHNLVESEGIALVERKLNNRIDEILGSNDEIIDTSLLTPVKGIMESNRQYNGVDFEKYQHLNIPVLPNEKYVLTNNSITVTGYAFIKTIGETPNVIDFCSGESFHPLQGNGGVSGVITAPEDAVYLCVNSLNTYSNTSPIDITPEVVKKGSINELDLLKALYSNIDTLLNYKYAKLDIGINLFDKYSSEIMENEYIYQNGYVSASLYKISHPIYVLKDETYKFPLDSSLGSNYYIAICNENGDYVESITGTLSNGYLEFTPNKNIYVRVNIGKLNVNSFMFCKSSDYSESYTQFGTHFADSYYLGSNQKREIETIVAQLVANNGLISSFDYLVSPNLFDKSSTFVKHGYYSSSHFISDENYRVTSPIPVKYGVTYKANHPASAVGSSNAAIAKVDKDNNLQSMLYGTIADGYITITPNFDGYISFNIGRTTSINSFMVCKSSEYPTNYTPYYTYYKGGDNVVVTQDDRLYKKSIIFTGDSICEGIGSEQGLGWASRIGNKNSMTWSNKGIQGGTLIDKNLVGSAFTISDTAFGSGADYIILEGGTNDADRIGSILGSTTPQYYGSYSETGYQDDFTNQTFCGAVEYLLKRVITNYPQSKVGFIIAPKMGVTNNYTKDGNNRRAYFETIIKVCKKWGVPVLNLWDECTMNPRIPSHYTSGEDYLYSDSQHLTSKGYDFVSPIIEAWIKTL